MTSDPLQIYPAESIYCHGQNRAVELRQYAHGWVACVPELKIAVEADGPNAAVRALSKKLKENG